MKDEDKTKAQLIEEVEALRQQIVELKASESERKLAERELMEREERLKAIFETVSDAIVTLDLQHTITHANRATERILGYSREELVGNPIDHFAAPESAALGHERTEKALRGEPLPSIFGLEGLRKDGTRMLLEAKARFLREERKPVGIVCIFRDVTERKQLEEQFYQSQKMEAIGRLAGGVAHNFNNLLTGIINYSDLVLECLSQGDPLREDIEEIKGAAVRGAQLTHRLLAFSRRQVLQPRVLDLNVVITDMGKMLRHLIGEDIDLVTVLDPAPGYVKADPGQIEQVILNLAINARDAMPGGGKLTISTANVNLDEAYTRRHPTVQPGPYVRLAVSDTGCGMDTEVQAHLFEPFFTTKEQGKGTGLGLSTVYGITKQSGGHIEVSNKPGQGATFRIYLPRVEKAAEVTGLHNAFRQHLPRGSETILLVEDEEVVLVPASRTLRQSGYAVLEARSGEEALHLCERYKGPIHLLVTDVVMPGMGGCELAERMASLRPGMKVIYMSGYTDDAIIHHGVLEAGRVFLQKPFTPDALVQKVRGMLDRQERRDRFRPESLKTPSFAGGREGRSMTLDELVSIVDRAYPHDGLIMDYYRGPDGNHGDLLARLIVTEIKETFNSEASSKDQLTDALRILESAVDDLRSIMEALEEARKKVIEDKQKGGR